MLQSPTSILFIFQGEEFTALVWQTLYPILCILNYTPGKLDREIKCFEYFTAKN